MGATTWHVFTQAGSLLYLSEVKKHPFWLQKCKSHTTYLSLTLQRSTCTSQPFQQRVITQVRWWAILSVWSEAAQQKVLCVCGFQYRQVMSKDSVQNSSRSIFFLQQVISLRISKAHSFSQTFQVCFWQGRLLDQPWPIKFAWLQNRSLRHQNSIEAEIPWGQTFTIVLRAKFDSSYQWQADEIL